MEAIKKQASKLRDQVAKQQQSVFRQFSARFGQDPSLVDEDELECHQNLQRLYNTTRAAKHFQRNIVRGVEGFIAISTKQMEIVKKLAEDCCKYGNDNQSFGSGLAKASLDFGTSHSLMEKERENLLRVLGEQVFEPLRDMIMAAPLEDARLLTYRYERIRQDVESQVADVMRRQLRSKEVGAHTDSAAKLQNAESKLSELRNTLSALGREATAAMVGVEAQQQKVTFDRLLAMVDAERAYHQNVASILDKLHGEMLLAKYDSEQLSQSKTAQMNMHSQSMSGDPKSNEPLSQSRTAPMDIQSHSASADLKSNEPSSRSRTEQMNMPSQSMSENPKSSKSAELTENGQSVYFVGEVVHPFDAQADGELNISVGDYVVVRQVAPNGWSEGECKGKAGWFPSAYVARRDKAPASKVREPGRLT